LFGAFSSSQSLSWMPNALKATFGRKAASGLQSWNSTV
jgi:hypothetical protein